MVNKKHYLGRGIVLVLLTLVGYIWLDTSAFQSQNSPSTPTQERCLSDHCFHLEIAKTPEQRSQGLMFRKKLDKDYGMVFVFSEAGKHPFWMKNTLIPLDMIRLDSGYKIVDIKQATICKQDPCVIYTPVADANYVIELNQGTAKGLAMKSGDIIMPK